jgi:hypothetical protein
MPSGVCPPQAGSSDAIPLGGIAVRATGRFAMSISLEVRPFRRRDREQLTARGWTRTPPAASGT